MHGKVFMVIFPIEGIRFDIICDLLVIILVANDMFVIIPLPDFMMIYQTSTMNAF